MSVDIGGYYGIIKNPYKNGNTSCFPYYSNVNQDKAPKTEQAYKPYKKSIIPQIVASGLSIAGLIVGAIFLKKGVTKLSRYLKYKKLIKIRHQKFHPESVKKGFFSKIKGLFHRKKQNTDTIKKDSFFKRLFHRKAKSKATELAEITASEPPQKSTDIFVTKSKIKNVQKDGFLKRLFLPKPIPEAPPKRTLDIIEGREKLPRFSSLRLKMMDLGCKATIFLRKYFPF